MRRGFGVVREQAGEIEKRVRDRRVLPPLMVEAGQVVQAAGVARVALAQGGAFGVLVDAAGQEAVLRQLLGVEEVDPPRGERLLVERVLDDLGLDQIHRRRMIEVDGHRGPMIAVSAGRAVAGRTGLLDDNPVLRRSIDVRNPYVDPINLVQVELLRRLRGSDPDPALFDAFVETVNGIAAGMRNTG